MRHSAIVNIIATIVISSTIFTCASYPDDIFTYPELEEVFRKEEVEGSFLVYDEEEDKYKAINYERCLQGFLPASTYKIMHTMIIHDAGVITEPQSVIKWDSVSRWKASWNQDLSFMSAFRESCVPCYQRMATRVGATRMRNYLDNVRYGNMVFDSSTVNNFWLEGPSRITQLEQVEFLRDLYHKELPFSKKAMDMALEFMIVKSPGEGYTMRAKAGRAMQDGNDIGWYVGILSVEGRNYYFALNIEKYGAGDYFSEQRELIAYKLLQKMEILPGNF
ncbi:penicillin-binding transpeptidase domain-containing protein [Roseivirga sp. BDSF3-8]|uniref:penicillin-binding transpeptidase domain-containing protein n=1 Tax=Roseivirga sp. BDSF3-8 TaxID=3241598 RepID=UPI0035324864